MRVSFVWVFYVFICFLQCNAFKKDKSSTESVYSVFVFLSLHLHSLELPISIDLLRFPFSPFLYLFFSIIHWSNQSVHCIALLGFPLFYFSACQLFINHSGIRNDRKGCISLWKHKWFAQNKNLYFSAKHKWFAGNKSSGSSRVCAQDGKITFSWKKDKVSGVACLQQRQKW